MLDMWFSALRPRAGLLLGVLMVAMLALSVMLAGCAQSAAPGTNASDMADKSKDAIGAAAMPDKSSPPAMDSGRADVMAENKTGYDKTQATIASIVPDGTYEKQVTYAYHSGNATAGFKLTVEGDVITAASASAIDSDEVSVKIIGNFNGALPDLVVGKKINELDIPKNVAGSSLTTAAFKSYVGELVQANGGAS